MPHIRLRESQRSSLVGARFTARLARSWCPASPPVDRRTSTQLVCRELDVADVAELPKLLRRTRVLKQHLVDVERVQLTASEAVDRLGHVRDEFGELRFVVARHRLACLPTLGLLGHELMALPGLCQQSSWSTSSFSSGLVAGSETKEQ